MNNDEIIGYVVTFIHVALLNKFIDFKEKSFYSYNRNMNLQKMLKL